jgi:hypothetical protein
MSKVRIRICLNNDENGLVVEMIQSGYPPNENLKAICQRLIKECGVEFSEDIDTLNGNLDEECEIGWMILFFKEPLSGEKGIEVDTLLTEINTSDLTLVPDPEAIAAAASNVYHLLNDFIQGETSLPEASQAAWKYLGSTLGPISK